MMEEACSDSEVLLQKCDRKNLNESTKTPQQNAENCQVSNVDHKSNSDHMDGSKHSKSANNLPGSKASVQENCVSVSGSESQKQLSSDMDVDVEYPGPSLKEHLMREESDSGSRLILDDVSSAVVQSDSAFSCSPDVVPMELDKENDLIELKSDDESGQSELKESHCSTEVVLSSECWETQESSNGKKRLKAAEMPKVTSRSEEKITCETDAIMTSNVSSVEMEQGDDVEVEVIKVAAEMDQRQAVISSLMEHLLGVVVRKSEMKVKTTFKNVAKPGTSVISGSTKKPRQQDSPKEPESQPGPSSRRTPRRAAKKAENNIRIYAQAEANQEAENEGSGMITQICAQCKKLKLCRYQVIMSDKRIHLCDESCFNTYKALHGFKTSGSAPIVKGSSKLKPVRKVSSTDENTPACLNGIPRSFHCAYCNANTQSQNFGLSWETMDFCSQNCLEKYQTHYGSHCAQCKTKVNAPCLGKYCVRFGSDIRQFCSNPCLESFKKNLKVCTYCQMDISNSSDSFLAPVGDKGVFKDFCSPKCMEKHEELNGARSKQTTGPPAKCAVCGQVKPAKVEVILSARNASLCSDPCFMAFKYANHLSVVRCKICSKYLEKESQKTMSTTYNRRTEYFCSKVCLSVFVLATRKIVPCASCKVKKYNFDMIERWSPTIRPIEYFCSLVCYEKLPLPKPTSAVATTNQALQSVPNSIQTLAVPASSSSGTQAPTPNVIRVRCEYCQKQAPISYQLMLRSGKTANFCSQGCASSFQKKAPGMTTTVMPIQSTATAVSPVPVVTQGILSSSAKLPIQSTAATVSTLPVVTSGMTSSAKLPIPVIQTVSSLAPSPNLSPNNTPTTKAQVVSTASGPSISTVPVYSGTVILKPQEPKTTKNKAVWYHPDTNNKSISCIPNLCDKEVQTDMTSTLVPVPVPLFVPVPLAMYQLPLPQPVPLPLPIPVPVFIPTTRKSAEGIFQEIQKIREKIPNDPYEAELLMLAEAVASPKGVDVESSPSEDEGDPKKDSPDDKESSSSNSQPSSSLSASSSPMLKKSRPELRKNVANHVPVKNSSDNGLHCADEDLADLEEEIKPYTVVQKLKNESTGSYSTSKIPGKRKRRRLRRGSLFTRSKRPRVSLDDSGESSRGSGDVSDTDSRPSLKYTYGVRAWKQWVTKKNAELENASTGRRKLKLFKTDLLRLAADELNYALCLFVKEVKRPNGEEYSPDSILYLCLGIQVYLNKNGRIDNIFTDAFYEKFTECLDEVLKRFDSPALLDQLGAVGTRVEEEHLWESSQLGAHSPQVLLYTVMYYNTKHFLLCTVSEHMRLAFPHIMKNWIKSNSEPKGSVASKFTLRYYPPPAVKADMGEKGKKLLEQRENLENPLRCPVKLHEFYLSRCPESIRNKNELFYLYPERSCVPDSPVWYSRRPLSEDAIAKMLHCILLVREIQEVLLKRD